MLFEACRQSSLRNLYKVSLVPKLRASTTMAATLPSFVYVRTSGSFGICSDFLALF